MNRLIERVVREYLLEERKYPKQKDLQLYDNILYKIISTYHQWFDRHGDDSLLKHIEILETKGYGYRIGATDSILVPIIKNNIGKIVESFKLNKPCGNRIIFIKKINNPHIEYFDFVEFVLQKDENKLSIITSAYSDNGNFLLNKLKTKKERLEENFCKNDYIVVEL
jgi:hypothetical protein